MDLHSQAGQVPDHCGRAVVPDYVSVSAHSGRMSTICANIKHELSLDRCCAPRQFGRMHIGDRIARARKAVGLSQAKLAEEINTAQTTISSWERGRTEPTRDDVSKVATALGVPVADIEVPTVGTRMVPVVGYVGAGDAAHFYDTSQGPFKEVSAPLGSSEQTVAAEIKGQSIGRRFDGWLVFYDEVRRPITSDQINELCVVGMPDGRVLVKWIEKSRTPGYYHLMSETEPAMLDQEVEWAAKVTDMRPR